MSRDEPGMLERRASSGGSVPPSAPLPLFPGQILLDKYEVERVLGVGGMGVVVSAMHLELGERVAIKAMLPEVAANRDHATRFAREAQAAARIKSEFVARVTDVTRLPDGTPFMVMEYLEGETLATYLDHQGALDAAIAVDLLLEACVALAEAHRLGIVHRDIKPANLFLARQPVGGEILKVLDFGISKSVENVAITRTTGAIGTPSYMSPEQLRSAGSVRAPADIWSLGVVLFEMLTNELPYEATTFADLCALVLVSPPTPPRSFVPSIPEALEAVILRCLERDHEARFQSVLELARELAPFASDEGRSLVLRIEAIGASRATLTSVDETPVPGRQSFASLPRFTPRSLGDDVADRRAVEIRAAEPGSPRPSCPPSSTPPVASSLGDRTSSVEWRTSTDAQLARSPGLASWGAIALLACALLGGTFWWTARSGPAADGHDGASAGLPTLEGAQAPLATAARAAEPPSASSASAAPPPVPAASPGALPAPSVVHPATSAAALPARPPTAPRAPAARPGEPRPFDDFGGRR